MPSQNSSSPPLRGETSAGLVRTFSDRLQQEDPTSNLAKGLNSKVQADVEKEDRLKALRSEWPLLFAEADHLAQINIPSEEAQLLKSSRALAQACEKFQKKLPSHLREPLRSEPPNISVVFNAINDAQTSWQSRRNDTVWGGVKASFAKVSRCAEDHSQLLAVIPRNDKYLSILCGSLSAIAKASVNHEGVADAVSKSLSELCEDIIYWKRLVLAHPDVSSIQIDVRELYVVIFDFLTTLFTKWSSSPFQRFVKSFDQNAISKLFETKRKEMHAIEAKMRRAEDLDNSEKMSDMKKMLQDIHSGFRDGNRISLVEELLFNVGKQLQRLLEESELKSTPPLGLIESSSTPNMSGELEPGSSEDSGILHYRRNDILAALPDVELKVKNSFVDMQHLLHQVEHASYDRRVQNKLQDWANDSRTKRLWLQGPPHVRRPSQNSLCAISLAVTARESGLNTLSFFCGADTYRTTAPDLLLKELLGMLIAQLLFFLPDTGIATIDLSAPRIQSCLSLQCDITEALQLFNDIRSLALGPLVCIIESAQDLEDRSQPKHTKLVEQVVKALCDVDAAGNLAKLCITSDGYVDFLADQAAQGAMETERYDFEANEPGAEESDRMADLSFSTYGDD